MAGIQVDGANQKVVLDSDGDTYLEAATDDTVKVYVAGAHDATISANAINVLSGTTLTIDSGATITNSGTASGFGVALDDITTGDAASTLATSAGNITIDAQGNDTDIIFKGTDGSSDTTFLTIDGSDAGTLIANHNLELGTDASEILFGADNEVKVIHNADKGLILKHTATADDKPVILTLQTGETDMAANDVIGKIAFQAPDEGTGTDAI